MQACGHWGRSWVSHTSSPSSLVLTEPLAFSSLLGSQWQPVAGGLGNPLSETKTPLEGWCKHAFFLAVWSYTLYYLEKRGNHVWPPRCGVCPWKDHSLEQGCWAVCRAPGWPPLQSRVTHPMSGVRWAQGYARCWKLGISRVRKTGPGHQGAKANQGNMKQFCNTLRVSDPCSQATVPLSHLMPTHSLLPLHSVEIPSLSI